MPHKPRIRRFGHLYLLPDDATKAALGCRRRGHLDSFGRFLEPPDTAITSPVVSIRGPVITTMTMRPGELLQADATVSQLTRSKDPCHA